MGIDIGNLLTKVVILDGDALVASSMMPTTGNVSSEIAGLVERVLEEASLGRGEVGAVACTGSGAELAGERDLTEDEVTCVAAAGAYYLPEINMVVDVGGQSITAVLLDDDGDVVNFMRNDKCASGSGRFLEVMSNAVGVGIDEIDGAAASARKPVPISSQCGVFAESEVITHVNAGEEPADIVAGLCDSVASIVSAQARRFASGDHYTLTGGVARIASVADRINEKMTGTYHAFPFDPRLAACIGAALLAGLDDIDY
ncbi:MAG: acyl-CoA dehydratase activase [Candidatus Geothermincolia bacterium]